MPTELALCQRYFQTTVPYGQNPATYSPGAGSESIYTNSDPGLGSVTPARLPAPMRTSPTIRVRDGAARIGKLAGYSAAGGWQNNYSITGVLGISDKGFSVQQNNAGLHNISFDYSAEAEI